MSFSPDTEYSARTLNSIDRFAALTVAASEQAARRARGMVSTMGFLCVVLFLALIAFAWRANAMDQENARLIAELSAERAARVEATLAAKGVEMEVANLALDTEVRRDIVDERMVQQDRRSAELAELAQNVERNKLVRAECVTPSSILAAGL